MEKSKNLLRKVMLGMMCAVMVFSFGACSDEFKEAVRDFFGWDRKLVHDIDATDLKAVDMMRANIIFTENDEKTDIPSEPAMETSISLSKSQINIDADLVEDLENIQPDSVKYDGKNWGSALKTTDNSVLQWYLPGGQVVTVPVDITALRTQYRGKYYMYGTDSLIGKSLSLKFKPMNRAATRSSSQEEKMNAVYTVDLKFKEVNHKDSTFTVRLTANAVANVKSNPSDSSFVENEHWTYVNDSTYTWDFDIVTVIDGDTTRTAKSIPANFWIKGLNPYEKIVKSFNYQFDMSNGWTMGTGEKEVPTSLENVTIYQKAEDHYGATIVNFDDNDKIVTDYKAEKQRVVYDDGKVRSVSDYPEITAKEASTIVKMIAESKKEGYNQANLMNSVDFSILEHTINVSEEVYLYVQKNIIIDKEIVDAKLKVEDDYVEASLTYKETYINGDVKEYKEKRSFARIRKVLSDWMSSEQLLSVTTGAAKVELVSTEAKEDGYWSWVNETHDITTDAHLYASTQTNKWRELVANKIVYTREGISHEFGEIEYVATEAGQKTDMISDNEYAYTDSISIKFDDNKVGMTAPGLIKVTGKEIKGHENRNKSVEVTPDSVIAKVDHVTIFTDGTEDIDHVSHSFPRVRENGPAWESYETDGNEKTGDVSISLVSSEKVTEGEWSWTIQTRNLTTTAKLAASSQKNTWKSKDPNRIQFTRNGITADFGEIAFSAVKNSSSSTLKESEPLQDTYAYAVGITETYGDDSEILGGTGTIIVKKDKKILRHEIRDAKLDIYDDRVEGSLKFVSIWNDGTETSVDDFISVNRSLEPNSDWSANSDYANVLTGAASVNLASSNDVEDGYWKYTNQTRDLSTPVTLSSSTQQNKWISIDPNMFVYEREGETYKFDEITYKAEENSSSVTGIIEETDTENVYGYTGGIKVTYGSNVKTSTAPGKVIVKKVVTYSIKNTSLTVNDDYVLAELDFVTTTDGKDKTDHYSKSFPKSLMCTTNWSSEESSLICTTGSANVKLNSSENISDGDWSYVRENRNITTTTSLAGSNQTNSWTSIVPNEIVFSKNGVSHNFGTITFSASEAGQNYKETESSASHTIYSYTDKIDVTYGSNTVSSTAPGKILVEKPWEPDVPAEYGKFKDAIVTATPNENRSSWVYVLSMHFENGTLPIKIERGANSINLDFSLFTSNTNGAINSLVWTGGSWVNSIASDEPSNSCMTWRDENGAPKRSLDYVTATSIAWNDGHNTVYSDAVTYSVSNNILYVNKGGSNIGQIRLNK
jgi:hypothetical protein